MELWPLNQATPPLAGPGGYWIFYLEARGLFPGSPEQRRYGHILLSSDPDKRAQRQGPTWFQEALDDLSAHREGGESILRQKLERFGKPQPLDPSALSVQAQRALTEGERRLRSRLGEEERTRFLSVGGVLEEGSATFWVIHERRAISATQRAERSRQRWENFLSRPDARERLLNGLVEENPPLLDLSSIQ